MHKLLLSITFSSCILFGNAQVLQLKSAAGEPIIQAHIQLAQDARVLHFLSDSLGCVALPTSASKSWLSIRHLQFKDTSFLVASGQSTDTLLILLKGAIRELPTFTFKQKTIGDDKVSKRINACYRGKVKDTIVIALRISYRQPFKAKDIALHFTAPDTVWHQVRTVVSTKLLKKEELMSGNSSVYNAIDAIYGTGWVHFPLNTPSQIASGEKYIHIVLIPQHRSNKESSWCVQGNFLGSFYYSERGKNILGRARGLTVAHRVDIILKE